MIQHMTLAVLIGMYVPLTNNHSLFHSSHNSIYSQSREKAIFAKLLIEGYLLYFEEIGFTWSLVR